MLAECINFYNPSAIVVGGELSEAPQQLLAGVREAAIGRSLPMATRDLQVASSRLGDRAGMIGAAIMVIEDVARAPVNVDRAVARPTCARDRARCREARINDVRAAPRFMPDFDPIAEAARNWDTHWGADPVPSMRAVTSIMRVQQILLARLNDELKRFDLTFPRYEALMLLYYSRRGALPLGKMGDRLQVHRTSVTNIIDGLERSGFVRREPHERDRRTTLAAITDAGRAVAVDGDGRAERAALRHRALGGRRPRCGDGDLGAVAGGRGRVSVGALAGRP